MKCTFVVLMVEQTQISVGHNNTMFITGGNNARIIGGTCGTGNIRDTTL